MTVQDTWAKTGDEKSLITIMGMACETDAYDPMEKAMLAYCEKNNITRDELFGGELITEYPFTNELKMMGHVWRKNGKVIIAAKGSPERILTICALSDMEKAECEKKINELSSRGLRVIAVAAMNPQTDNDIPEKITDCSLTFLGLVGLADPPRESVKTDIAVCNKAGIRVVMITGDNGGTAASIAKQIGMKNYDHIITGDMLNNMTDEELQRKSQRSQHFLPRRAGA